MNRGFSSRQAGLSLVEVMVSLVLGLLVVGAALTVFLSNSQTFRVTEGLARVQESSRIAFELMTRDLREAGGNACERDLPVANVLNDADDWWNGWSTPVTGYGPATAMTGLAFGTAEGERVNGTEAYEIRSAINSGLTVAEHQPDSANLKVNVNNHGLSTGDVVMVCDFAQAAIFQVTAANQSNGTIGHNTGGSVVPGNRDKCLDVDGTCPTGPLQTYTFGCYQGRSEAGACSDPRYWPAHVARLRAWRWFVGNNANGGTSLYRTGLRNRAGVAAPEPIEVAENISDMEVTYRLVNGTSYVAPASVTNWNDVLAMRIALTVRSPEAVGVGNQRLQRVMTHVVALRNRTP